MRVLYIGMKNKPVLVIEPQEKVFKLCICSGAQIKKCEAIEDIAALTHVDGQSEGRLAAGASK